ncbi:MAG: hypothetical protein Q4D77_05450 [Peptostreptococcaceae bacterium]|nr:hypothetical protein [Peptostreptococcaceae bacterium]
MHSFYSIGRWLRISIGLLGMLALIGQAVNIVFASKRITWKHYRIRQFFEYILLINITVLATIPSMLNFIIRDGFLPPTILEHERVITFVLMLGITILRLLVSRQLSPLLNLFFLIPMLPIFEKMMNEYFFVYYVFLMLYFLIRDIYFIQENYRAIRSNISVWSIKEALDSLHSGILFCHYDGSILLLNRQMKKLMIHFGHKLHNDGLGWFKDLEMYTEKQEDLWLPNDDQMILNKEDKNYWHFSKEKIMIGSKVYWQITATDVTTQWNLVKELEEQDRVLRKKSMELNHMINNMFQIQKEQERNYLRGKLHDVLSQRITLFQRWMQSDELPTAEQILQLINTLRHGFNAEVEEYSGDSLQTVIRHFEDIGIKVRLRGVLPPEPLFAGTFVLVVREATTNAVRHGLATEVFIDFEQNEKEYILKVRNDGIQNNKGIQYGNGLRIMEERMKAVGGSMSIELTTSFLLTAVIPKGRVV